MNVQTVKEPAKRIEFPNITNLGIIAYGYNNLYPQDIKAIVSCSESGTTCLRRYIDFIQGNGFKDEDFSEMLVNKKGDTADDILQSIASDLGSWGGFALHVNYNLACEIVEVSHIPFENTRLTEEDEQGDISKIAVFPDWSGSKKRVGKLLKPTKETIDYIDRFNPNRAVIMAQIERAGDIENYKGQVLWVSSAGPNEYPKAVYDCVITQLSTEEGLGNIANRNARNSLLPSKAIVFKKGQDVAMQDDDKYYPDPTTAIAEEFAKVQGDMNTNKIVAMGVEYEEEIPIVLDLQGSNYDKDFTVTTDTACEKIYAAFMQEAWHRIRKGSVGFSSDIIKDTYDVYSSNTGSERRMIERAFDKIFKIWHQEVPTSDFTVQPLKYISSEASNIN